MAKIKLAGSKKAKQSSKAADIRGALPCLVVVLIAIGLLMMLLYFSLQSANQ